MRAVSKLLRLRGSFSRRKAWLTRSITVPAIFWRRQPSEPEAKQKTFIQSHTCRYSGTLLWTPWGPGGVSCIQWNPALYCEHLGDLVECPVYSGTRPSIVDTLGTWWSVLYTVEPGPLSWTPWGPGEVSSIRGVLILGLTLY